VRNRSQYDQEEDGPWDPNAPVLVRHEPESHIQVRAEVETQDEVLPVPAPAVVLPEDDIWAIIQRHIDNHGFDEGDNEDETVDTEENDEDDESHISEYTVNTHDTESTATTDTTLVIPFDDDGGGSEHSAQDESLDPVEDESVEDADSIGSLPTDIEPDAADLPPDNDVDDFNPPDGGDIPADERAEEPVVQAINPLEGGEVPAGEPAEEPAEGQEGDGGNILVGTAIKTHLLPDINSHLFISVCKFTY